MTDAEKGALLLAWQQGCNLQYWDFNDCEWEDADIDPRDFTADAYRIRPEPKRETVELYGSDNGDGWQFPSTFDRFYRIAFTTLDGEPDCASIKMERLP